MSKKELSEEAEQRISSIKTSKARSDILSSLVNSYSQDICNLYSPQIEECDGVRSHYKVPDQKADVEKIVAAINKVIGKKYHLRHEVVCKIASDNVLTFVLDPSLDEVKEIAAAKIKASTLREKKAKAEKDLSNWKRRQMLHIANGLDFEEFKFEP